MKILLMGLALAPGLALGAAPGLEGRWQGVVAIPERAVEVTVDLAPGRDGALVGSITSAGLGLSGAPLGAVAQDGADAHFALAAFGPPGAAAPPGFRGRIGKDGALAGTFTQAGLSAPFALHRSGPAQVELPPAATPVSARFAGTWVGDFELLGTPRHVTVTLANADAGPAHADFVVIGKKTTSVAVDFVREEGDVVRLESSTMGINLEARANPAAAALDATVELGPLEIPFALHRPEAAR